MKKRTNISRRTMLRGMAGGALVMVGLPILDAMLDSNGGAFADGSAIPIRLLTWCFGNGILLNRWVPGGIRVPVTGPGYPLSEQLQPLVNVKDYVTVLSGFENKSADKITHHEGMSIFNGYTFADKGQGPGFFSNARGPTIDQIYANAIDASLDKKPSIIRGVHTGVVTQKSMVDNGTTLHNLSHVAYLNSNPPMKNAQNIHQMFIDLFTPPDDPSKPSRLSVVDTIKADAAELRKRLGMVDQQRLDGHLAGLSDLENKISALPPLCVLPGQPMVTTDTQYGKDAMNRAVSDLLVFAFSCDVTRIGSVLYLGGASEAELISGNGSHHELSHSVYANYQYYSGTYFDPDGPNAPPISEGPGPNTINRFNQGVIFLMTQLAYLLEKLQATPDAAGTTLLDNSVVFASSDCSDGWTHDIREHPMLICGKAGGRLVHPGIHFRAQGKRNASDALLSVLQTVVPTATQVGANDYTINGVVDPCFSTTPVTELLVP
jgi:hypothetical protein